MPRVHKVWKRKQDGWYYVTLNKKKVRLSQDKDEAETAMYTLLSKKDEEDKGAKVFPTFRKIADLFLENCKNTRSENTYRMNCFFLQGFCDHIKRKRVADLRVHHVTEWVNAKKERKDHWNDGGKCSGRSTVLACLNWAVAEGHIDSHPLTKMKRGKHGKRERVLTLAEREKIRANVKPDFRDFLFALEQTGARPFSELALVTAQMVDWEAGTVTFVKHKNANKGKSRTIYATPELMELFRRLAVQYPTGYLFRNSRGGVWTSHDATRRLNYVINKIAIPKATVYSLRHSYITDALSKGLSADIIAELVGNSAITIAKNYSHLHTKKDAMMEAAKRAVA